MMPHTANMKRSHSSSSISSTLSAEETPGEGTPSSQYFTPPASPPPENDENYLTFSDASITNNQFCYITHVTGNEAYMKDYCLDMALKILAHNTECSASQISIASTFESQIFYFAASDRSGYEEYLNLFKNAKWIFIPINDGMAGKANTEIQGAHWSLLALLRVSKTAHYFDSWFINSPDYHQLAEIVFRGIANVLDEDVEQWMAKVEYNSPNQTRHNLCKEDAWTSCGPFVFTMVKYLVSTIQWAQRGGVEGQHTLDLADDFPRLWGADWSSLATRLEMQDIIAQMKEELTDSEAPAP